MKKLIAALLFCIAGAASAVDYSHYVTEQYPVINSLSLLPSYSDTLTFQIPAQYSYPNGNTWVYDNSINLTVQGEWQRGICSGRGCVAGVVHVTMPVAPQLWTNTGNGLVPAVDVNGGPVVLVYSALKTIFGTVDRWVAVGAALPAGIYTMTGIAGAACSNEESGVCLQPGGGHWTAVMSATWTFIPAPPPCDNCD